MKYPVLLSAAILTCVSVSAQFQISSFSRDGSLVISNSFTNGVCTVERSEDITAGWQPAKNIFTIADSARVVVPPSGPISFYRLQALDLSSGRAGFTNLTRAYGLLSTVAGAGGVGTDGVNKWQTEFEGGPAVNAFLSRPHIAMADAAGNIFIADKDAHAIRKVTTDGLIHTVAGTNGPGNAPDEPTDATEVGLSQPNGLWVKPDGTTYILDLVNGKIRKLDTNGMLSTLFAVPGGIVAGRGLWVNDTETLAYVASGTIVKKWTPDDGVTDLASGFVELGNLVVNPWGKLVITDRRGHRVWRIEDDGTKTAIAGNGFTSSGGDGQLALQTGLNEVRGVWFIPTGAYFVCTHRGSQVWYVDTAGYIHLFLNGSTSNTHSGDGTWFYDPFRSSVSENRAITADFDGNLLITENDSGYIRKVTFLPFVQ